MLSQCPSHFYTVYRAGLPWEWCSSLGSVVAAPQVVDVVDESGWHTKGVL
jgi:hypothetical protein